MKLLGCRNLLGVLLILVLGVQGCADTGAPESRPWRILAGDTQGVVVTDGKVVRGYQRESREPGWEIQGNVTGAACASACPNAALTFVDRDGLFRARGRSVTRDKLPQTPGTYRVLLAQQDSVVLLLEAAERSRLLERRDGDLRRLLTLSHGSPLWYGTASNGTLFLLREAITSGVTVGFREGEVAYAALPNLPHGVMCYGPDAVGTTGLPDRAYRSLKSKLDHLSGCLKAPPSDWVGVSNYLAMGADNGDGIPSIDVAVARGNGTIMWHRTFAGGRNFDLAPGNATELAIVSGSRVEILTTTTGVRLNEIDSVADAKFVSPTTLVTISPFGQATWHNY